MGTNDETQQTITFTYVIRNELQLHKSYYLSEENTEDPFRLKSQEKHSESQYTRAPIRTLLIIVSP